MEISLPSEYERHAYYSGLPGVPKLVAKSSPTPTPWLRPPDDQHGHNVRLLRTWLPAGGHEIAGLWNTPGSLLVRDIITGLNYNSIQWTVIDIVRVCFSEWTTGDSSDDMPVVLLVSVKPDSTEPKVGLEMALRCKAILELYGIFDVHCEIKESVASRLSGHSHIVLGGEPTTEAESAVADTIRQFELQFSQHVGLAIAPLSQPFKKGTKGLYLRRKDTGAILTLTCRHVALPGDHKSIQANTDYAYNGSGEKVDIIQLGQGTWEGFKLDVKNEKDTFVWYTKYRSGTYPTSERPDFLAMYEEFEERIKKLDKPESRVFGHAVFSPSYSLSQASSGHKRLRDWALIELHRDAHQSPLEELKNHVYVNQHTRLDNHPSLTDEVQHFTPNALPQTYKTFSITLSRTIHETEIEQSSILTHANDPTVLVAKYGGGSGLGCGYINTIRSILKHNLDGYDLYSSEYSVLGHECHGRIGMFSGPGDSGACVWDSEGRVVGMITSGGLGWLNDVSDLTYFTPIEWLLGDIRSYGFDVELVD